MNLNKLNSEMSNKISEILSELTLTISQLESLKRALKNPTPISQSTANTSLKHLLSLPELNIGENLSESQSFFLTTSFKSLECFNVINEHDEKLLEKKNTSSTLSESSTSGSSVSSIFSKIFFRKTKKTSIPSINSANDNISVDSAAIKLAEKEIEKLENNGKAGTLELSALSNVIGRKIIVFSSNETLLNNHEAGRTQPGKPLEIQFHKQRGYWNQVGVKDSASIEGSLYNCLFIAIAAQTQKKPTDLHPETIKYMKKHVTNLTTKIYELIEKEKCSEIVLLITGPKDTSNDVSLDNSRFDLQDPLEIDNDNDENLEKSSQIEKITEFSSNDDIQQPVKRLVLVLRHHYDDENDPQHDVFIQTLLP